MALMDRPRKGGNGGSGEPGASSKFVITLWGGPLHGVLHERDPMDPIVQSMGLCGDGTHDESTIMYRHWYVLRNRRIPRFADYSFTEHTSSGERYYLNGPAS